jgi:hypothetical protein
MTHSLFSWLRGSSGRKPTHWGRRWSFVPQLLVLEDRNLPSIFPVTTLADAGPGSLRQALTDANNAGGDNTIPFAVTGTITLESALPDLSTNLTLEGPGPDSLTIDRDWTLVTSFSILAVDANATVTVSGVALVGGSAFYGGGIYNDGGTLTVTNCALVGSTAWRGGGIFNLGSLTVHSSTLTYNSAANNGGGIANFGPLAIDHSTLTGNSGDQGGAVYNFGAARLAVCYSTLSFNAAGFGGAIANNGGTVTVDSSTVADNTAAVGGGLANPYGGSMIVSDSTLTGNRATYAGGGGIYNDSGAALDVFNSTIAGNSAASGGGIANAGTLAARDTILADNLAPVGADLAGDVGSLGHNLIGNAEGGSGFDPSDLLYVDPLLDTTHFAAGDRRPTAGVRQGLEAQGQSRWPILRRSDRQAVLSGSSAFMGGIPSASQACSTIKCLAMSARFSTDGSFLPDSHCDTADCVVPTRVASLLWVIETISIARLRRFATVSESGCIAFLLRLTATNFSYVAGIFPRSVTVGDVNGDGLPDLAVANFGSNDVSILLNDGLWGGPAPRSGSAPQRPFVRLDAALPPQPVVPVVEGLAPSVPADRSHLPAINPAAGEHGAAAATLTWALARPWAHYGRRSLLDNILAEARTTWLWDEFVDPLCLSCR